MPWAHRVMPDALMPVILYGDDNSGARTFVLLEDRCTWRQ
jgi:hypothetical protein